MDNTGLELMKSAAEGAGRESVNKLAEVIGGVFPFFGVKRVAVKTYISDIEKSNLPPEAKMMAVANAKKTYKHLQNQIAIAEMAQKYANAETDFSLTSNVNDEWLERFMDSAKFVSDEEIQVLWASVLSSEFENPNSTPPSVIRILSEITKPYAKAFSTICQMNCLVIKMDSHGRPISKTERQYIIPPENEYQNSFGLNFNVFNELELLGLIRYDNLSGFVTQFDKELFPKLHITDMIETATIVEYPTLRFPIGHVILTQAGRAIANIVSKDPLDGYFNKCIDFLKSSNVVFAEKSEIELINGSMTVKFSQTP